MIKKFDDLIIESSGDKVTITLTKSEAKLLTLVLKESEKIRGDMSCNDPYRNEERLFSKSDRVKMLEYLVSNRFISKEDAEEMDDFMYNDWYSAYLRYKIKEQIG